MSSRSTDVTAQSNEKKVKLDPEAFSALKEKILAESPPKLTTAKRSKRPNLSPIIKQRIIADIKTKAVRSRLTSKFEFGHIDINIDMDNHTITIHAKKQGSSHLNECEQCLLDVLNDYNITKDDLLSAKPPPVLRGRTSEAAQDATKLSKPEPSLSEPSSPHTKTYPSSPESGSSTSKTTVSFTDKPVIISDAVDDAEADKSLAKTSKETQQPSNIINSQPDDADKPQKPIAEALPSVEASHKISNLIEVTFTIEFANLETRALTRLDFDNNFSLIKIKDDHTKLASAQKRLSAYFKIAIATEVEKTEELRFAFYPPRQTEPTAKIQVKIDYKQTEHGRIIIILSVDKEVHRLLPVLKAGVESMLEKREFSRRKAPAKKSTSDPVRSRSREVRKSNSPSATENKSAYAKSAYANSMNSDAGSGPDSRPNNKTERTADMSELLNSSPFPVINITPQLTDSDTGDVSNSEVVDIVRTTGSQRFERFIELIKLCLPQCLVKHATSSDETDTPILKLQIDEEEQKSNPDAENPFALAEFTRFLKHPLPPATDIKLKQSEQAHSSTITFELSESSTRHILDNVAMDGKLLQDLINRLLATLPISDHSIELSLQISKPDAEHYELVITADSTITGKSGDDTLPPDFEKQTLDLFTLLDRFFYETVPHSLEQKSDFATKDKPNEFKITFNMSETALSKYEINLHASMIRFLNALRCPPFVLKLGQQFTHPTTIVDSSINGLSLEFIQPKPKGAKTEQPATELENFAEFLNLYPMIQDAFPQGFPLSRTEGTHRFTLPIDVHLRLIISTPYEHIHPFKQFFTQPVISHDHHQIDVCPIVSCDLHLETKDIFAFTLTFHKVETIGKVKLGKFVNQITASLPEQIFPSNSFKVSVNDFQYTLSFSNINPNNLVMLSKLFHHLTPKWLYSRARAHLDTYQKNIEQIFTTHNSKQRQPAIDNCECNITSTSMSVTLNLTTLIANKPLAYDIIDTQFSQYLTQQANFETIDITTVNGSYIPKSVTLTFTTPLTGVEKTQIFAVLFAFDQKLHFLANTEPTVKMGCFISPSIMDIYPKLRGDSNATLAYNHTDSGKKLSLGTR